ncbi:MAG TPA: hypothetical protein VF720_09785 [Candidatus Eisenbacteria bacterium]
MIRRLLSLALIFAVAAGTFVPVGLTRCEVKKSCCGCGPAMEMTGCCCGPEAAGTSAPVPAPRVDIPLDWTALAVDAVPAPATNQEILSRALAHSVLDPSRADHVPLFLSHHAFLI